VLPEIGNFLNKKESGELRFASEILKKQFTSCTLCPNRCGTDRTKEIGLCSQNTHIRMTSAVVHKGEEPPLVEKAGAGTVFFSGCTMKCLYCQNFAFSQLNNGRELSEGRLAEEFLKLQSSGASNLDLVSPTPHLPGIIAALDAASERGLTLPVVYNTSGYERVETLRLIDGIVDIYLTDIRYTRDENGRNYSSVPEYWKVTQKALREMHRQVGSKGMIIRLLVLPEDINGTEEALSFIAEELSTRVRISLMSQYFPVYKALATPPLNRKITRKEYENAVRLLETYGFENGWTQDF
jgi:putative pyruvate formate lyase activating enzyme